MIALMNFEFLDKFYKISNERLKIINSVT